MKTTNGIFIVDCLSKVLIVHPTNHPMNFWSIPKGLTEVDETSFEAGVRETLEETMFNVMDYYDNCEYYDLGVSIYPNGNKQIHGHLIVIDEPLSIMGLDLKCNSLFTCEKTGEELQENDIVRWETFEFAGKNLHHTQQFFLKIVANILLL